MGRKKIKIASIENNRQKHITFMRRKAGIIKKCHELAVLCNAKVMLMVWDGSASITPQPAPMCGSPQADRCTIREENHCHAYATHPSEYLLRAYEAAYLGVGDSQLSEYHVEQVGEGSEDLVVRKIPGAAGPLMRRVASGAALGPGSFYPGCQASAVLWGDLLTPEHFKPPSIAEIRQQNPAGKIAVPPRIISQKTALMPSLSRSPAAVPAIQQQQALQTPLLSPALSDDGAALFTVDAIKNRACSVQMPFDSSPSLFKKTLKVQQHAPIAHSPPGTGPAQAGGNSLLDDEEFIKSILQPDMLLL